MKSIFLGADQLIRSVYTPQMMTELLERAGMVETKVYTYEELKASSEAVADADYIFTTWGFPPLTTEELQRWFPNLKAVFYAAGSVQTFARVCLENGVRVFSAWQANAVPVAEFTTSQILLANKGYFGVMRLHNQRDRDGAVALAHTYPGNYDCKVGIIAAGQIGRRVIRSLVQNHLQVLVYDPYLTSVQTEALGAKAATLEQIFTECQTISNHLPDNVDTRGMLNYALFSRMKSNATFINTGRGAQVVEDDLIRALTEEPARTALIDVTEPEVLPQDHPFYDMPNVLLTPHIAGSMENEVHRLARYMIDEFDRISRGEPPRYEVSAEMLRTMA